MKSEVARDLPPRTNSIMYVELDDAERTTYDAIRAATQREIVALLQAGGGVMAALEALLRDAGVRQAVRADTLEDAVATADALARDALATRPAGTVATVLLSPAAASFDMFVDYAARGRAFIAAVGRLAEGR